MRIRYVFGLLPLFLVGCVPQQEKLIAYSGDPRPDADLALLKTELWINIVSIDGDTTKQVHPLGARNKDTTVYLEPGMHHLRLYYRTPAFTGGAVDMDVLLLAGHRYSVVADIQGRKKWDSWDTWRPVLDDMTNHPEIWCVNYPIVRCRF